MATLMYTLQMQTDVPFNFTPQWDSPPIANIDGCPAEFVGTYILFPIGENVNQIFTVTTFDSATGQIIGTVDLGQIPASGTAFGYGLNRCESVDSYPSWNVNFVVEELYYNYSKNPIEPYISSAPTAVTEIEIFAETLRSSEVFVSLGVFTYRADNNGIVSIDVSKILDAHLGNNIRQESINALVTYAPSGPMYYYSSRWYYSRRYQSGGTWPECVDGEQRLVLYGGRAYEDLENNTIKL